jgi:signal transduction histidine kinase
LLFFTYPLAVLLSRESCPPRISTLGHRFVQNELLMDKNARFSQRIDVILLALTFVYQGVALVAFLILPFLAINYINMPFIGAFTDNTLVTNGVGPQPAPASWSLFSQGVGFGDQIVLADSQPVRSYTEFRSILLRHYPGETIPLVLRSPSGGEKEYLVTLSKFSFQDQVTYLFIPYSVGLVYLVISWWIFGLRRSETAGQAFIFFATSAAVASAGLFDIYTTNGLTSLWSLAIPLVGGSLFHLAVVFPQEARLVHRYRWLRWTGYLVAIILALLAAGRLYDTAHPTAFVAVWRASYTFTGVGGVFFLLSMVYRYVFAGSPVIRRQAGVILLGAAIGFAPITFWLLSNIVSTQNFNPLFLLPLVLFPITTGYTVLRHRLLRTDYLVSRTILYSVLASFAMVGYVLLDIGISLILMRPIPANNPLLISLAIIGSVALLLPLYNWMREFVDSIFFRGRRAHQQRIQEFTRTLTSTVDTPGILRVLRENIKASLVPSHLHIYVHDALNDQYVAAPDESGRPSSDIRFQATSALPKMISKERLPVFLDESRLPTNLEPERARLALLGANLFVPMPGQERLIGWIALGERLSGEAYTSNDLDFLDSLANQAAVAVERSQIVTNMERRVHELNVLARIAQGINITLTFDDILELIYAQTVQVVPGTDFHLTLFNKTGQYYYYGFCLENDERLSRHENTPLLPKTTLDQEVVTSRRPIITQDYLRECQVQNVTPTTQDVYAWIGVPLNTGAETIGALSVDSRDPSILYTSGQLELLQAIADQAAGAIVKARLLQETERRAQQLSILNVITRQLTSTLDIEPLLKNILENAVNILNSEAGSLFLIDEQTDELVFRVTAGPVASDLVGQRLPPGTGVVGRAVNERAPVIVNEVQSSAQWSSSTDRQTGFMTRALLAVPMEVKDRVIGVIEIINKKDGLPFTEDDQNLLSSFAGQAAVAIENARLYTLTDQELAARVEELSVMQRIDRELNASLEVDRAMRITLDWAMRQSGAEAGMIGILQESGINLTAQQGYGETLVQYRESPIPADHPALAAAVSTGQPQRVSFEADGHGRSFLPETHSQMVIPIRRESKVIGLFLLESSATDKFGNEAQGFLSRLSDHAAIAIANAQLYAEVQAANNAKSEFVSFVAHELKNPMTSIKGYSELLAAGAVGTINDMQSNFLSTIRSNVERMSTLVSDLNDNSKIEAGRLRLEFKAVDVNEVADETIRSAKKQLEEKEQTIAVEMPEKMAKVWADRTRLAQVIINLISNAHKYTPQGGSIIIGAEQATNQWDPQGAAEVVHIWVKDNGIGISPEDQEKIFQKFFRSEDQKAREAPGTGLGLNITKSLVEMQGGRIWFESVYRQGTTFHFTVPVSEN